MSIATLFIQCLSAPAYVDAASAVAASTTETGSDKMADGITCPPSACAATTDDRLHSGDTMVPSAEFKPWSVVLFVATTLLLTSALPRKLPVPPQPLLPKRPRTLKFYALRI